MTNQFSSLPQATEEVANETRPIGSGSTPKQRCRLLPPRNLSKESLSIFLFVLGLAPGLLLTRAFLPGATPGETFGMVPVLGVSLLALVTIFELAITRSALTSVQAWTALIVTFVVSGIAFLLRTAAGPSRNEPSF